MPKSVVSTTPVAATLVVAANDSKSKTADYTCDGSADESEINQAIQDLT